MKEFLVTRHWLHPFNVDYFSEGDERLFSFSVDNCRAGEVARGARLDPRVFVTRPIGEPEDEWRTVDIASLIAFFRNPAQFFIKKRLGTFGLVVFYVIIASPAAPAVGLAKFRPTAGRVHRAAELCRIDKGFDHQHRMAVASLPIGRKTLQGQTQYPAGQVGHRAPRQG